MAFRKSGAKDWRSNLSIALDHSGATHKLQFHHIFPKALLTRKTGIVGRQADDIANLCFISGKTNRQISDKAPGEYFPTLIGNAGAGAFQAQCIPTSSEFLDLSNYKAFLELRRGNIAKRLNEFLDIAEA